MRLFAPVEDALRRARSGVESSENFRNGGKSRSGRIPRLVLRSRAANDQEPLKETANERPGCDRKPSFRWPQAQPAGPFPAGPDREGRTYRDRITSTRFAVA